MRKLPIRNAVAISTVLLLCFLSLFGGCREIEENTPTSGTVTVLASESIAALIESEANEFHRIYPSATVHVLPVTTREAFVHLLNDSVKAIAVDRPLNNEERSVVASAKLKIAENVVGSDAVVVLVHRSNTLRALSLPLLRDVLSGQITRWEKIPNSGKQGTVHLVLTGRNSGLYEILSGNYGRPENPPQPSVLTETQTEIIRAVEKDEGSMGMIFFSAYEVYRRNTRTSGLKAVPFQLPDTTVHPTQLAIYQKIYPLSLPLYYYTREQKAKTASGFATFIKSLDGQKLIQKAGIVPVTIPSRTIQITQE